MELCNAVWSCCNKTLLCWALFAWELCQIVPTDSFTPTCTVSWNVVGWSLRIDLAWFIRSQLPSFRKLCSSLTHFYVLKLYIYKKKFLLTGYVINVPKLTHFRTWNNIFDIFTVIALIWNNYFWSCKTTHQQGLTIPNFVIYDVFLSGFLHFIQL